MGDGSLRGWWVGVCVRWEVSSCVVGGWVGACVRVLDGRRLAVAGERQNTESPVTEPCNHTSDLQVWSKVAV